jgi:predicted O-linked N-acetylglucosamine transferase (SPINDLY family)
MPQIDVEQALQTARRHHQAGRIAQATMLYEQILCQDPNHADALHLSGVIAAQSGRTPAAVDLIQRALRQRPDWAEALYDLGNVLARMGKLVDAAAAYRRAIALKPGYAEALSNLGVVLKELGELDDAIAVFQQAISIQPDSPATFNNLGNALKDKGRFDESIAAYRRAITLKPNLAELHNNLGVVLKESGQLDESIAACRQAITLQPGFAEAHANLGVALEETGQLDAAAAAYRQAIALKPGYAEAHHNLGNVLKATGQLDPSIAAYRQAIALKPALVEAHSNLVYALHFHPAYDAKAIAQEQHRWSDQHAEPLKRFIQPHSNERSVDRRLRIGYVSPDFREHPVGRFLLPLLAHHDKSGFEIFAYSNSNRSDGMTQQLRSHTDIWREITRLSDPQAADQIRDDKIDILIDLTMHMAHNRLLLFARKPAPVQITWLAYCSSTGLDAMDYRLSDPYLDPPESDDSIYSEQTIRLPETYWCYQPSSASPEINRLPALEQNHITFGCLNNFTKVSDPTLAAWTKLLHAVPNSRLLLHAPQGGHRWQLQDRLARDGIDEHRLRFAEKAPMLEYLRLYNRIDIALDTFPYGGGTTTCDALWMGVPVITLVGNTAVGRGGLSILSNLGLPELIARSEEEYVRLASELANDLPRLSDLRTSLRQQMERSPLMDAPRFARNVESAYRQTWRSYCSM